MKRYQIGFTDARLNYETQAEIDLRELKAVQKQKREERFYQIANVFLWAVLALSVVAATAPTVVVAVVISIVKALK